MAQAKSQSPGGFTAVHVWMIGFVFLWLTSTVLLVWLYTDQEDLKQTADKLKTENKRLARGGDKGLPWYGESSASGPSMASLLNEARKETAKLAIGEEAEDVMTVRTKVGELFDQIISDGLVDDKTPYESRELLPAMTAMYQQFKRERNLRTQAEDRAGAAEQRLSELTETVTAMKASFDESTDGIKGELSSLEKDRAKLASVRDKEVDDLGRTMDDLRQSHSREIQGKTNEIREVKQRYSEVQKLYEELQAKLGELQIKPGENLTARREDGRVVMAIPGDKVVFIDLGKQQNLTAGLQFAVYPASGIPVDGRAKARIEVVVIHESTAQCRILAVAPNEVVIDGDLIANPVYDPSKSLRFVVVGDFDLNGDGLPDPAGADQIKAIVTGWGGQVADSLSSQVDFVVAGHVPFVAASASSSSKSDRDVDERDRILRRRLDSYDQVISSARNLSIPILNQDVFLQFLGLWRD